MKSPKFSFVFFCSLMFIFNVTNNFAQTGCHVIDFETNCSGNPFPEGLYVPSDAYDCIGVTITNNQTLPLVLFNSSAPTGNDPDLGTPSSNCPSCTGSCPGTSNDPNGGITNCVDQGLILITEENPADANMDGLEDEPDDHNVTDFTFTFSAPVTISSLSFVDDSQGDVIFTFSDNSTSSFQLLGGLDNDVYNQIFNEPDVVSIQVMLNTSGAMSVTNFCFDDPAVPPCDIVAPLLGADVGICAGDDPGPIEVVTPASGTGTITYQWQQSLTGCFGFGDIAGATSPTYNPGVLVQSTFFRVVISTMTMSQVCIEESNCISYTELTNCTTCTNPIVTASAVSPSCILGVQQDDGFLQITNLSVGDAYHFSLGNTFDDNGGANTFANATNIMNAPFPLQFALNQPNPNGSQDFTIRVYNGANNCFTDAVVTMNETVNCPLFDLGDLPDTGTGTSAGNYETQFANSGPSHQIIPGLSIGSIVDDETDGQQSADATGDSADEDGFSFPNTTDIVPGGILNLPIDVTNTTGIIAHYEIWIDWNGDGDFNDPNEMVANLSDDGAGNFGQNSIAISVPANATKDQLIGFRARLSHTDNITPNGQVLSGEVEDYVITVSCKNPICLPIGITKITN